jgi:putative ABC transport system permease protein
MHTDDVKLIYDFAEKNNIVYEKFNNADSLLVARKNDPILQGTNGVLTVSFIIVLLVCMTGFLIYWVLSIRSRELQFGIFRAMGMSMGNILSMLINEHILLSLAPILAGTLIGYYASDLFVPLIQMGYSYAAQSLPLRIIAEPGDYIKLFAIVAIMLIACVVVLGVIISKIRIAQALKLGED